MNPPMALELLPCPFCGNAEPEFERRGTARQSCIVVCGNCGARHESSDEGERSGSSWNERSALAAPVAPATPSIFDKIATHAARLNEAASLVAPAAGSTFHWSAPSLEPASPDPLTQLQVSVICAQRDLEDSAQALRQETGAVDGEPKAMGGKTEGQRDD